MIINQGRLEQKGSPLEIYTQPMTPFVAKFMGETIQINAAGFKGFEAGGNDAKAIIRPEFVEIGFEQELSASSAAEFGVGVDSSVVSVSRGTESDFFE